MLQLLPRRLLGVAVLRRDHVVQEIDLPINQSIRWWHLSLPRVSASALHAPQRIGQCVPPASAP